MYTKRILIVCIGLFLVLATQAQSDPATEAEVRSLNLYNSSDWNTLLKYGKERISSGIDFPLLRMRVGYAAFMQKNYSQSLVHYQKVLKDDPTNGIALYYVYLDNLYLNNLNEARYYAALLPGETKEKLKIGKIKVSSLQMEYSYKIPTSTFRKNAQYARLGLNIQPGYRLELQQSVAIYNQRINESAFTGVLNNQDINIQQKEYYGKLLFAPAGNILLKGGFHYLHTPYNNLVYNSNIIFGGIKYTTPYVHLEVMANFSTFANISFNQYDGSVSIFPLGNTKLYSITRGAYGDDFTLSQIIGYGVLEKLWLEGNITLGKFNNLFENDALYVYNDIDRKLFKAGSSVYTSLSDNVLLTINYTFEQKLKYGTSNNNFYQHSINGGLTWKF